MSLLKESERMGRVRQAISQENSGLEKRIAKLERDVAKLKKKKSTSGRRT